MSILNLFHLSYYFDNYAYQTFPGFWVVLGLAVVVLVGSVILKNKSKSMVFAKRAIIAKITAPLFISSWILLVWMFFRYEGVVYLAWRLWPTLILIYLIVSGVLLYRFIKVELPQKREKAVPQEDVKQSYLRRFARSGRAGGSKKK